MPGRHVAPKRSGAGTIELREETLDQAQGAGPALPGFSGVVEYKEGGLNTTPHVIAGPAKQG